MKNKKAFSILLGVILALGMVIPDKMTVSADTEDGEIIDITDEAIPLSDDSSVPELKLEDTQLSDSGEATQAVNEDENFEDEIDSDVNSNSGETVVDNGSVDASDDEVTDDLENTIVIEDDEGSEGGNSADQESEDEVQQESDESLEVEECSCGAEDDIHKKGCPLYKEPELSLYERLMAAETIEEFMAIIEEADEEKLNSFTCEEFDELDAHYLYLSKGEVIDRESVVYEVQEIVDFTNVAPFVETYE